MTMRLRAWKGEKEITSELSTAHGLRTLGGFTSRDVVYCEIDGTGHRSAPEYVCMLVCGAPEHIAEGYRVLVEELHLGGPG